VKKKVIIALNTAWNLHNFRSGLIRALVKAGYEVVAVAPSDDYSDRLSGLGCRFVAVPMDNHGMDPVMDAGLFLRYFGLLRREKPFVFLGYTIKPNIYGSLAAHLLGIPVINNITGLGRAFARNDWLSVVAGSLYRLALSRSRTVFFQNEEDREEFVSRRLVRREITERLPGSGIDLLHFSSEGPVGLPGRNGAFRFLLVARLLWEKGVGVFVDAARIVRKRFPEAEFRLLGFLEESAAGAVPELQVMQWIEEGVISYAGQSDDVRHEMMGATCVVLPSFYREGVPRSLLEAAALGRPLITTDTAGCREVVDDGRNGFLCRPCDVDDLAAKMLLMMSVPEERLMSMGRAGRAKVEREFDERIVIGKYVDAIGSLP